MERTALIVDRVRVLKTARLAGAALLDVMFPKNIYCICCDDSMEPSRIHGICDRCAEKIEWLSDDPFYSSLEGFSFDRVAACCRYGFFVRRIMNRLKLQGEGYIAEGLGRLMGERLKMEQDTGSGPFPAIITSVPMHREKLRKRGYNQAELLAEAAARECGLPFMKLLVKQSATASMRGSDAAARRGLLKDSFALAKDAEISIQGAHIVLADDVITTGSTADSCARLLRSAGASRITVLCFAVSGDPAAAVAPEADFEFPDPAYS